VISENGVGIWIFAPVGNDDTTTAAQNFSLNQEYIFKVEVNGTITLNTGGITLILTKTE
jgi:hypothetical protein